MRIYLNRDWEFTERFLNGSYDKVVTVPHTSKETPFHYFDESEYQMISGYRKVIFAPEEWKDKKILLTFEGVAHFCEVFLNGNKIGEHACGYTAFTLELEELLYGKENTIVVKVDSRECLNVPPFGHVIDYMTYGGIYRDVYLEVKEQTYLKDVFLYTDLKKLYVEVSQTDNKKERKCEIFIENQSVGKTVLAEKENHFEFQLPNVEAWTIDNPKLYDVKVRLSEEDKVLDEYQLPFGFRTVEFRKDGFYLNGEKIKIRGLNRHQSYPYVGYAMPASMQRLDANILKKELGLNAVRTSHYPQSHDFIRRCDELGILVFTEFPGWQYIGDDAWKEQAYENVKEMVMQYRNHPSIIIWGVRINESPDDDAFYERTNAIAHKLDPSRPTGGVRNMKKGHFQEDVYTYNDFSHDGTTPGCDPKRKVTPNQDKGYLVTEYNGHMFPTKAYDCEPHRKDHAIRHATVLNEVAKNEEIAGSFGWCMADYNTHRDFGSGDRICYHGVLDMFRNPKMAAAVYASQQDEIPVLETSSSMEIGEYPASTLGESYIFTNAEKVRVYKNDKFVKEYKNSDTEFKYMPHGPILIDDLVGNLLVEEEGFTKEQADATKYIMNSVARYGLNHIPVKAFLKVPKLMFKYKMTIDQITKLYTKYIGNWGESAVAYRFDAINGGKVVKSITKAPMKQMKLEVKADHQELVETHTYDVALLQIKMVNEYGNVLTYCHEPIFLEPEGPIEIIGPTCITLQGGVFGTYVKSNGEGEAKLRVYDRRGNEKVIHFLVKNRRE